MVHKLAVAVLLLLLGVAGNSPAEDEYVPVELAEATNLAAEARLAMAGKTPILLLVSQEHCSFCMQIKEEILGPMILSGEYQDKVLIRELSIDPGSRVRDFQGQVVDGGSFALRYNVYLTPTLLFIGPDGGELTDRLVGIQTPELFFHYVEDALDKALAALRDKP